MMKRLAALILALHLIGQWGLQRLVDRKLKQDEHSLYCFCQNCPGEPFCCCGKAQTPSEGLRLASVCDRTAARLLAQNADQPIWAMLFAFTPFVAFETKFGTEPLPIIPSDFVSALEKPPRFL